MTVSKPTPTQAEADAHARGEYVEEHEDDGSPIQYSAMPAGTVQKKDEPAAAPKPVVVEEPPKEEKKAAVAETHRASYQTRRVKAKDDEDDKAG